MFPEKIERTAMEIHVTEENITSSNIMCMIDFFEIVVHKTSYTLICIKNDVDMNVLSVSGLSVAKYL